MKENDTTTKLTLKMRACQLAYRAWKTRSKRIQNANQSINGTTVE